MSRVSRPIVPTVVALVTMMITAYIAVSTIEHLANGGEVSVRGVGFPLLLTLMSVLTTAFAAVRWVQRRRYVESTTPEERAHTRRTPRSTPSGPSATASTLDYGERVDGGDQ